MYSKTLKTVSGYMYGDGVDVEDLYKHIACVEALTIKFT